jgi:hypothetical protein
MKDKVKKNILEFYVNHVFSNPNNSSDSKISEIATMQSNQSALDA